MLTTYATKLPSTGVSFRGKVLFNHGFCDDSESFNDIWPELSKIGFEVISFDQRGVGKTSPGKLFAITNERLVYEDLDRIIEFVTKNYSDKLFLAGHSMVSFRAPENSKVANLFFFRFTHIGRSNCLKLRYQGQIQRKNYWIPVICSLGKASRKLSESTALDCYLILFSLEQSQISCSRELSLIWQSFFPMFEHQLKLNTSI